MKRLLPLCIPVVLLASVLTIALHAQAPPPQVPKVGWLWDTVTLGRHVSIARNDNWPPCGSVAVCASFFVPQHECGVQVYELGRDKTWQGRSAYGETGTQPDYAGFKRERQANPDGKGLPGCNLSFKNWADGPITLLLAWPNQNDSKIVTKQQKLLRLGDFVLHEDLKKCIAFDPLGYCVSAESIPIPPLPFPAPRLPLPPNPGDVASCLTDPAHCPIGAVKQIVTDYLDDLQRQAKGRWKGLPLEFINQFAESYPEIDLHQVRYATNINTHHGQSMTLCNDIYLTNSFTQDERSSLRLMLHELYHTVQCQQRGGVARFLDEYIAHALVSIVQKRSINVHDDINIERDAIRRASALIDSFGWPIVVDSQCGAKLRLFVQYKQTSGTWVTAGWYTLEPRQQLQIHYQGKYAHTVDAKWYLYAEEIGGSYKLTGTHAVDFDGARYMASELEALKSGENLQWTRKCGR